MNNISYYNSDRLIFWKTLKIKITNLKKEKKEKTPIFKTTYSLGPLQVKKSGCCRALYIGVIPVIGIVFKGNQKIAINFFGMTRVCNFLWAARSRLIDVGGDSVTK